MDGALIGQVLNGYVIVRPIGTGGMARVYTAYELETQQPVAIKIMLPELSADESFRARFWREAELMITLRHPHIVPVFTYGEWRDYLYIVMQLIKGPTLESVLRYHRFSPLTAWQIVRPVADALSYGHEHNVLHRDLKTGNILIERVGEGNHVYLTDFGLGKRPHLDTRLTATGISVGTPEYMAPEVALGHPADHRADLYSFGVILYELLLGILPFQGANEQMTALAHIDEPVPLPRAYHPQFPQALQTLLLRALAKEPEARYQSAREMQHAFYTAVQTLDPDTRRTCFWVV
ncbi:MAG: hypothetical protein Kow00106_12850 [Anaerolineae bacterium]